MATSPQLSLPDQPDPTQTQMEFHDSTWFRTHGLRQDLPTPEEVIARCRISDPSLRRPVAKFKELDLVVKFGDRVTVSEAVCLRTISQLFSNHQVPVPEVYGWRVINGKYSTFIYMQLIRGPTLQERWDTMGYKDRTSICAHLQRIFQYLRSTKQDPLTGNFIGQFSGGPSRDRLLEYKASPGPWSSVKHFHDWLSRTWRLCAPEPDKIPDPWRQLLDDNRPIVLTHGDVHRSNIIVSATSPVRVLAIIDWEQSGWYPDYWEYCKTLYTVADYEDWVAAGWVDSIFTPHPNAMEAFHFYSQAMGP